MKVNFNQPLKNYDGTVLTRDVETVRNGEPCVEKTPIMIGEILAQRLYNGNGLKQTGDTTKDSALYYDAFILSQQLASSQTPIDLSVEQCSIIKMVALGSLTPGAYGQVVDLIERKEE